MKLLIILLTFSSFLFQKKPATNARVIIEDASLRKQVGLQVVGEKGKAGFQYLNEGSYRLLIEFPQQEGKWLKENKLHSWNLLDLSFVTWKKVKSPQFRPKTGPKLAPKKKPLTRNPCKWLTCFAPQLGLEPRTP